MVGSRTVRAVYRLRGQAGGKGVLIEARKPVGLVGRDQLGADA